MYLFFKAQNIQHLKFKRDFCILLDYQLPSGEFRWGNFRTPGLRNKLTISRTV